MDSIVTIEIAIYMEEISIETGTRVETEIREITMDQETLEEMTGVKSEEIETLIFQGTMAIVRDRTIKEDINPTKPKLIQE